MSIQLRPLPPGEAAKLAYHAMYTSLAADGDMAQALIALVAERGESKTDPSPNPPWCPCETCQAWLFRVHWARLTGEIL